MKITELEPKQLWANFVSLNAVPRPSKKEEKVIAFMVDFGKRLGLETFIYNPNNITIEHHTLTVKIVLEPLINF